MPKGIMKATSRLVEGTQCHSAFKEKVQELWDEHGPNFDDYPAPKVLVNEFKELLVPYAPNQNNKGRDLYKRLVNRIFDAHG